MNTSCKKKIDDGLFNFGPEKKFLLESNVRSYIWSGINSAKKYITNRFNKIPKCQNCVGRQVSSRQVKQTRSKKLDEANECVIAI